MNKLNKYSLVFSIIAIIGVALVFIKIEKLTNLAINNSLNQQKQSLSINQKDKNRETSTIISQQLPVPEIKPYLIRVFDERIEPAGYTVSKNTSIEITVENKSSKEIDFSIETLKIKDQLKPNETTKYTTIIPDMPSGAKIEWKIGKTASELVGMFIIQ